MSEIRKIKLEIEDFNLLEKIATELGYTTHKSNKINVFGVVEDVDIIFKKGSVEIGFKREIDGSISQVFDNMYQNHANTLISRYKEETIISKLRRFGWKIKNRLESGKEIILHVTK